MLLRHRLAHTGAGTPAEVDELVVRRFECGIGEILGAIHVRSVAALEEAR